MMIFMKGKGKRENVSELANRTLKKALFGRGKGMFGELKGLVSTKDVVEEEAHEELCR